ncbi:hypothetical protein QJS66_04485 [Kocuria rhizophila]|nr:hypothetical protein QJS66_04485 [Kocuria rhizophila]
MSAPWFDAPDAERWRRTVARHRPALRHGRRYRPARAGPVRAARHTAGPPRRGTPRQDRGSPRGRGGAELGNPGPGTAARDPARPRPPATRRTHMARNASSAPAGAARSRSPGPVGPPVSGAAQAQRDAQARTTCSPRSTVCGDRRGGFVKGFVQKGGQ